MKNTLNYKWLLIVTVFTSFLLNEVYADPLELSSTEMAQLKKYFPDNSGESRYTWNGDAIPIDLPLNQEKRIIFPEHVVVDVKGALNSNQLTITNNDKSLYLKAIQAFPSTRLYITLQESHQVLMIDIKTDDKANAGTTKIDLPHTAGTTNQVSSSDSNGGNLSSSSIENPGINSSGGSESETYVTLLRHAWRQLYAPTRLSNPDDGVSRTPMESDAMISYLIYGDKVIAHPLASWTFNNTYITAVSVRNKYPHLTTLHVPKDICGDWIAVSTYPRSSLASVGVKDGDSTTLFLLSNKPFAKATEVCHASSKHE